ncbi:MauE/DoxX family redox-associated membrane protein [Flavobacterium sp. DGU38]|uniref:MauE/DoxX family redox-associated membrane protein n=1 Tax=Flavobacterium calami TaxID=3139144 RepID=A0ABU9INT4_9FLAO
MKSNINIKSVTAESICLLYILLFVYAAVSKLLDFENFQVQLGQSPLLSAYALWVSWMVPIIEIIIVLLLIIPKFRSLGFLAAFNLMAMFTVYIFIVLHYGSFVPCSCGGILEKMSWNVHIVFNIVFVLLAALAIVLRNDFSGVGKQNQNHKRPIKKLAASLVISTVIIILLFLSSEEIMHHDNPFIRRYPQHPAILYQQIDLKFNSYYFAGYTNGKIYLGNYTNPLQLLSMDSSLQNQQNIKISFDPKKIPFQMATIIVKGPTVYLKDGTVPAVYKGSIKDWKINKQLKGIPYFTQAVAIDSLTLAFRSNDGKNYGNILGIFVSDTTPKVKYKNSLLQKQIDGVFDTDGILLYSEQANKIVYLYFYRNEFIIADKTGKLDYRGQTIDTTTKAKIKVSYLNNHSERKMSAPPFIVNANAAVYENLLFVHSKIKGKFENDKIWDQASIIDVYNLNNNSYLLSFPLYNIADKKLDSFIVTSKYLYAIIGNELVAYELKTILKKEIKSAGLKDN